MGALRAPKATPANVDWEPRVERAPKGNQKENALDRARMRQANRIFDSRGQVLTKKELVNIEAQDILQSTVFD